MPINEWFIILGGSIGGLIFCLVLLAMSGIEGSFDRAFDEQQEDERDSRAWQFAMMTILALSLGTILSVLIL